MTKKNIKNMLTVLISSVKPILYYASLRGIDADTLLSRANIDPPLLDSPNNRISIELMDRIFKQAMALTKDENLGLHVGELYEPGSANILGHILMNCRTMREILLKFIEYNEILSGGFKINISHKKNGSIIMEYKIFHTDYSIIRQHVDYLLCGTIAIGSALVGRHITPLEVRFQHKAPQDITEYQRIFKAPLRFDQPMNALVYDKNFHEIPVSQANLELLIHFEQYAQQILSEIRSGKAFTKKISSLLVNELIKKQPTIKTIAEKLSMTVRSLQRRLDSENTSYRIIFNDVYKKTSISYLLHHELSVTEIAYLLGFSEPSTFRRAFKRWTGLTPNEYRLKNDPDPTLKNCIRS